MGDPLQYSVQVTLVQRRVNVGVGAGARRAALIAIPEKRVQTTLIGRGFYIIAFRPTTF